MEVNLSEMELTIDLDEPGKDSLTLELSSLHFSRLKQGKYNMNQIIQIHLDKILMREGKNLPMIQMLKVNREVLKAEIILEKKSVSSCLQKGVILLNPI